MRNLSQKFDHYLLYSSPLSKTGVVFIFIALFLTAISFVKGIQVLMFVPALILALFLYSLGENWYFKKYIHIHQQNSLFTLSFKKSIHSGYFKVISDNTFLTPDKNFSFPLEKNARNIKIMFQGKLDIVRTFWNFRLPISYEEKKQEDQSFEIHIREYQAGDTDIKIDALRTAQNNNVFIREEHFFRENEIQQGIKNKFLLKSSEGLRRRTNTKKGLQIEWILILLGAIGSFLQWQSLLFLGIFCSSTLFLILSTKKLPQKFLNPAALFLFCFSIFQGFSTGDSVQSGAHFLILLAVWKHAFSRERRDGITIFFLILFVFVALSLYSIAAWFLFFFIAFLILSSWMFSLYSGGELSQDFEKSFGTLPSKYSLIQFITSIFFLTILCFILLPHGNEKQNTSDLLKKKESMQTGFSDQVSLNDVGTIKNDYSKKIVIENAKFEEVKQYQNWYWRGARFDRFDGETWQKKTSERSYFSPTLSQNRYTYEIKYYLNGEKNVFLPFPPLHIEGQMLRPLEKDNSIMEFFKPQFTAQRLSLQFDTQAKINTSSFIKKENPLQKKTTQIFQNFWNTIPEKFHNDPQKLSTYIQNSFTYSLDSPATDIQDFLYGSQQGHCEYFASTLALTLQHFGYEAYLTNGFHGGEWNEKAKGWVVRNENAHSWVEIKNQSDEWVILDPTPINFSPTLSFYDFPIIQQIIQTYDAIEIRWNKFIVSFTGEMQKEFLLMILSYWKWFIGIFGSLMIIIQSKKIYIQYILPTIKKTPRENFLLFLKKNLNSNYLFLDTQELSAQANELMIKTKKALFGKSTHKELTALQKEWKILLRKD